MPPVPRALPSTPRREHKMAGTAMSQRWIVTGGSRGVGLAVARLALAQGDRVAVVARNGDSAVLQAQRGKSALAFRGDVTDPGEMTRIAKSVAQAWGGIDVLVNNAGLHRGGKIERLDLAAAVQAGVVDQHVDAAPGLRNRLRDPRHLTRVGHVATERKRALAALRLQHGAVAVARHDGDAVSLGKREPRDRKADAA